ncbi:ABC transporter permease [Falsiroseomonas selenitidurans]|uniref:ABC transporter permease n=1 Tax=Falsiroseomonas selenitidurans TaxID=2716335 RepID=A0ABX1E7I3_9PROT|nr:ABC transporter permease [Falsiroseomonas selenitidurans]NKC33169.1 ABC transporter permease [Falsiroseomonas selenitidurans]
MAGLLGRRLALVVPLLAVILLFTFLLVRISGSDPVGLLAGPTATTEEIALVRASLALDQPVWVQFGVYFGRVLQGDLGQSWLSNRPVLEEILDRAPATIELLFWGVLIGAGIGIPAGLRAAFRPDGGFDQVTRFLSLLGFSVPTYWLGLIMLFVFFYLLGWAPPGMGRIDLFLTPPDRVTGSYLIDGLLAADWEAAGSAFAQLVLPVLCVAIIAAAPIIKQTRAIALEVLASDYIRYARAQGLPDRQIRAMALRNSMTPVVTFIGTEITGLVGTTSLIEYVFAWGGLGQYGLSAIIAGDFAVVQGYVLVLALFSVLVFLVVDVFVLLTEPRAGAAP